MAQNYNIHYFSSFASLPSPYLELIQHEVSRHGLFREPAWFNHLMKHVFDEDDNELRLYGVEDAESGAPLLFAPLRHTDNDYAVRKAHLIGSISHPENYTSAAFFFAPSVTKQASILEALFKHLRLGIYNHPRNSIDALRIWPVELESTLGKIIHQSLLGAGFRVQTYTNSYNRFEDTRGLNYESYFAKRSANMRYNVRRRHRALERSGKLELEMVTEPSQLQEAIPQYMIVSNASWKSPASMYSLETLQLINLCAGKGCLRLGIMRFECIPVAVQFWIVTGGAAHCARLAYHESYKKQAVGVVLTNFMIAHLLDQDRVNEIDFGYGPDEYKRDWMNSSRHYNGFMAFNPSTPRGRIYGIKHIPGRAVKRFIKWGLAALGWQRFKAKQEED